MNEPSIVSQLLGNGAVILGFISAGILAHQLEKQKEEERRRRARICVYDYPRVQPCIRTW